MLRTFKRIGAALVVAAFILPHFAFAAWTTPNAYVYCMDAGFPCDPGTSLNDTPPNESDGWAMGLPGEVRFKLYSDASSVSVNGIQVAHLEDSNEFCDNTEFYTSSDNSTYTLRSTIVDEGNGVDNVVTSFTAVPGTKYIGIKCLSVNSGTTWAPSEVYFTFQAGAVPEMGVWALLVILPIMGYVVYKSAPATRPIAV